jgi:5-methylcytosine-specific restriction protein A
MPLRPPLHRPSQHDPQQVRRAQLRVLDRRRGSASSRGYDTAWQRLRVQVLMDEPLCRFCTGQGRVTPARDVDHILPITQRPDLRLVRSNLRPLCQPCHSAHTARGSPIIR